MVNPVEDSPAAEAPSGVGGLLAGRVALVTGAAAGLGAAIAHAYAAAGALGTGLDREDPTEALPPGWRAARADVTVEDEVAAACAQAAAAHGRIDVLVANAGIVPPWAEIEALDLGELDRVMAVNLRGVAACLKHAVPLMRERGGAIVVMASLNAHKAHPRQAIYTASKHAVLGLVRAAAADLGRYGIRVNAIGPGPVATPALIARVERRAAASGAPPEAELAAMAAQTHLGRIPTQADVAGTALYLASDLSSGQAGQLLCVDCGIG